MKSNFLAGMGLGLAIGLAIMTFTRPRPAVPDRGAAPTPAAAPVKDADPQLAAVQKEAAELRDQNARAKARIDHLEATIRKFGEENKDLKDKVDSALETEEQKAKNAAARAEMLMKSKVMIGKELPEEMVAALELDAGQKEALNQLLVQEGPKMYDQLRAIAAENGIKQVPAENSLQMVIAVLGPTLEKEQAKVQEMFSKPEAMTTTQYLDELLGADSTILKITERCRQLRQQTLAAAAVTLTEAQREKLAKYLACNLNFSGAAFSFPENFEIRRK